MQNSSIPAPSLALSTGPVDTIAAHETAATEGRVATGVCQQALDAPHHTSKVPVTVLAVRIVAVLHRRLDVCAPAPHTGLVERGVAREVLGGCGSRHFVLAAHNELLKVTASPAERLLLAARFQFLLFQLAWPHLLYGLRFVYLHLRVGKNKHVFMWCAHRGDR